MPTSQQPAHITLTVRGDELDRTGSIGAPQLLRYCEHGRWQATARASGSMAPLFDAERKMVVRAQRIQLGVAAAWGDELVVQTWLARLGTTSVDIGHKVTREHDGAVIAEALLTGVQIDGQGRPIPLAPGLAVTANAPQVDGALAGLVLADAWPEPGWTWQQTIRPSQTDLFRHVNHSRYIDLYEDARWFWERAGAADGWTTRRSLQAMAVEYRREAKAGEDVQVQLRVRDAVTLDGRLVRGGELLSRCVLRVAP